MFFRQGNIELSLDEKRNFIRYDNVDYPISSLNKEHKRSKGGNSNVFRIKDVNTGQELIIKFSKYDLNTPSSYYYNRIIRFEREIEALILANQNGFQNIIKYYFDDSIEINSRRFRYYVMEKADFDLMNYLDNNDVSLPQRFFLCVQILNGIKELHSLKIYHRDIKPDNILYVDGVWKIGDLGLIDYRASDYVIDEIGEKIGPVGWLSPEAANKFLNEGNGRINPHKFDCNLDSFSDVFQLGKLFWYIFQGNIPIGQIHRDDFKIDDREIYDILIAMIRHSKNRPSLSDIENQFSSKYSYYNI